MLQNFALSLTPPHGPLPTAHAPLPFAWRGGMRGAIEYELTLYADRDLERTRYFGFDWVAS